MRAEGQLRPVVSVIVATTHAWPVARATVDAIHPQVTAHGGELIVVDGDGEGLPHDYGERYPGTVRLSLPRSSVFALRAAGVGSARADLIAMTEDHCVPSPDWCERIVAAHAQWPGALAVGGTVENGSTGSLANWGNFLLTFSPFAPPFAVDIQQRVPPPANVSYKRAAVATATEPGQLELRLNHDLLHAGKVVLDQRVRLAHVQPVTLRHACRMHFHNGRTTTGLASGQRARKSPLPALIGSARRVPEIFGQAWRGTRGKTYIRRRAIAAAPVMMLLALAHSVGELVGELAGPGTSPNVLD